MKEDKRTKEREVRGVENIEDTGEGKEEEAGNGEE